ncbi:7168_t:CDS:2 [Dentiscutata erythropus]|uniref:7168_t:CDS:1 n=1 Tax=Dentiscutata erythropus TaxID=1348616 RepID=A0A9N9K2G1_9GLOM|nr:7168_t:CDS:2 [Dentiscutata erythropus]
MNALLTTDETYTDTLVDDLLRIVGLNTFPLAIRNHQEYRMFIGGLPYLAADPEFSIKMIDTAMIAVEDKHLEYTERWLGYGECQIVAEILACASDNLRQYNKYNKTTDQTMEQTMYAVRVISTYVTFYKTVIPELYFKELSEGLPQEQSIEILRWPGDSFPLDGLNLGEPEGRREVLEILVKIHKHLTEKGN